MSLGTTYVSTVIDPSFCCHFLVIREIQDICM